MALDPLTRRSLAYRLAQLLRKPLGDRAQLPPFERRHRLRSETQALTLALGSGQVSAEDPITLSAERGSRIAAELRAHGVFCLRATTLKRTIVRLDGRRTYRVACGVDGGAPVYLVTMPPGQRLGRP